MRFKIDQNLPIEIADLLAQARYDARTVDQQGLQGASDGRIIEVCREEGRSLITLDTDFSDIRAYPPEEFEGIIVLRVGSQAKHHLIRVFQTVIPLLEREPLNQHLWIVEETMIRIHGKD